MIGVLYHIAWVVSREFCGVLGVTMQLLRFSECCYHVAMWFLGSFWCSGCSNAVAKAFRMF